MLKKNSMTTDALPGLFVENFQSGLARYTVCI